MTVKINEEHLGDIATKQAALDMIQCLRADGYDVEYGIPIHDEEKAGNIPDMAWDKCLDTANKLLEFDNRWAKTTSR